MLVVWRREKKVLNVKCFYLAAFLYIVAPQGTASWLYQFLFLNLRFVQAKTKFLVALSEVHIYSLYCRAPYIYCWDTARQVPASYISSPHFCHLQQRKQELRFNSLPWMPFLLTKTGTIGQLFFYFVDGKWWCGLFRRRFVCFSTGNLGMWPHLVICLDHVGRTEQCLGEVSRALQGEAPEHGRQQIKSRLKGKATRSNSVVRCIIFRRLQRNSPQNFVV